MWEWLLPYLLVYFILCGIAAQNTWYKIAINIFMTFWWIGIRCHSWPHSLMGWKSLWPQWEVEFELLATKSVCQNSFGYSWPPASSPLIHYCFSVGKHSLGQLPTDRPDCKPAREALCSESIWHGLPVCSLVFDLHLVLASKFLICLALGHQPQSQKWTGPPIRLIQGSRQKTVCRRYTIFPPS